MKSITILTINKDFELLTYVIGVPNHTSHIAYLGVKDMLHYINFDYKKIDVFIGKILDNGNFENLLIISDHGLSLYKKVLYFNHWIKKKALFYLPFQSNQKKWKSVFLKLYGYIRPMIKPNIIAI